MLSMFNLNKVFILTNFVTVKVKVIAAFDPCLTQNLTHPNGKYSNDFDMQRKSIFMMFATDA